MLNEDQTDAIRQALLAYMREWSEDNYCAGWLIGLEERLHRLGGTFRHLGRLVGWPKGPDARDGWETWEEAAARWETDEWKSSIYGPQWREILAAHEARVAARRDAFEGVCSCPADECHDAGGEGCFFGSIKRTTGGVL